MVCTLVLGFVSTPVHSAPRPSSSPRPAQVVIKGRSCRTLFATEGTTLMCLPRAKGKGLTWQKYPVESGTCAKVGVVAKPAGMYCKKYATGFARKYASPHWIAAPGPFRYFTVYGNSWQPRSDRECAVHNTVVEWELFQGQWTGYASCLPNSSGTAWTWQQKAQLKKTCARAGVKWGDLVCGVLGGRRVWTKAPKTASPTKATIDGFVEEARALFGRITSMGWAHFSDQYRTYNNSSMENFFMGHGFSGSIVEELQKRAFLGGVTIRWEMLTSSPELLVASWSGGQRCFSLREIGSFRDIDDDMGTMYNGSPVDVPEISCDASEGAIQARALSAVTEIDEALWRTGDIATWRTAVFNLGSSPDLVAHGWKPLGRFYLEVDFDESGRVGVSAGMTMDRTTTPATATSTSYRIGQVCYRGGPVGNRSALTVVICA